MLEQEDYGMEWGVLVLCLNKRIMVWSGCVSVMLEQEDYGMEWGVLVLCLNKRIMVWSGVC